MNQENIKVAIRIRPYNTNQTETKLNTICVHSDSEKSIISIDQKSETKKYEFDYIADADTSQENLFDNIANPLVNNFFDGYNTTLISYGQTGSGKSFSILGPLTSLFKDEENEKCGIIPRVLKKSFEKLELIKNSNSSVSASITFSCFQIYKEQIFDLLINNADTLNIREDQKKGIFIENLSEQSIENENEGIELILMAFKNRNLLAKNLNIINSKSTIGFTINFSINSTKEGLISQKTSKFNIIDLAGFEKYKINIKEEENIQESLLINKSIITLENTINSIIEGKIPSFKDSKLVHYLKDSFGGNTKMLILGNVSPSLINLTETISTIKLLQKAKQIKNTPKINENITGSSKILQDEIKKLKEENAKLKESKSQCANCKRKLTVKDLKGTEQYKLLQNQFTQNNRKSIDGLNSIESNNLEYEKTKEIIDKVDFLLNYEALIKEKLDNLEKFTSSCSEISKIRDKYQKESDEILIDMEKKKEHFFSILKIKENLLNEMKGTTENKKLLSSIDKFFDETNKFQKSAESFVSNNKFRSENSVLKNDIESMKKLKNIDLIFNKEGLEVLVSIINDFVESNRDIETFIKENTEFKIRNKNIDNFSLELNDLKQKVAELESKNSTLKLENLKLEAEVKKELNGNIQNKNSESEKKLEKLNEENETLKFSLEEIKLNEIENEKKIQELEKQKENFEISQNKLMRLSEECETLQEGILAYEKDIIEKNEDIANHRKNLQGIILVFDKLNQWILDKLNVKNEMNSKLRTSILGDKETKNSSPGKKNTLIFDDNSNLNNKLDFSNIIKEMIGDANENSLYSQLLLKSKNEIEKFLTSFTKFSEKIKLIDEEMKNNEISIKIMKKELDDKKDEVKKRKDEVSPQKVEKRETVSAIFDTNLIKMIHDQLKELKNFEIEKHNSNNVQFKAINDKLNLIYEDKNGVKDTMHEMVNSTINIEKNTEELFNYIRTQNNDDFSPESSIRKKDDVKHNQPQDDKILANQQEQISKLERIVDDYETEINILRENHNEILTENSELKENLYSFETEISKLKENISELENENSNLKETILNLEVEKLQNHMQSNQINESVNQLSIPERDKTEHESLQFAIQTLKEEKKRLQNEIQLLSSDFYKNLSESAINKKIRVLMQIKEENYKLKLELQEIKKKNEVLEITVQHIQTNNINNQQKIITNTQLYRDDETFLNEEFNQTRKEYNDLLEKILDLKIDYKSKQKSKYLKAIEYINFIVQTIETKRSYHDYEVKHHSIANLGEKNQSKEERRRYNRSVEYDPDKSLKNQEESNKNAKKLKTIITEPTKIEKKQTLKGNKK